MVVLRYLLLVSCGLSSVPKAIKDNNMRAIFEYCLIVTAYVAVTSHPATPLWVMVSGGIACVVGIATIAVHELWRV
jgi:phosphate/sulfate permease